MTIGKKTRHILFGIGNELKGDDGIGNVIAREFGHKDWLSIPCETVPENFTSVVKRERPETLVIVDAADMGIEPGGFRIVPKERLNSDVFGTHGIPLKQLVSCLEKHAKKIIFIGVQPEKMKMGGDLSQALENSKKRIMGMLERKQWEAAKLL